MRRPPPDPLARASGGEFGPRSDAPFPLPAENVYGHLRRLDWMRAHLRREDRVVEVGCGTGYRVTLALRLDGYDIVGVDIDDASVRLGRELARMAGVEDDVVSTRRLEELDGNFDVIIVSEVFEHLHERELDELLAAIRTKLVDGGRLLVTVPNGYGWFEAESFLWYTARIGAVFTRTRLVQVIRTLKKAIVGRAAYDPFPSTLSTAPHVQRFTLASITARLRNAGFTLVDATGSVLVCGPFTNLAFTGFSRLMKINGRLGARFPRLAAGFYVAARKE